MRTLLTAVFFVVGQLLAEVKAFPCDQYTAANRPVPGRHPDSYIQNNEEKYCPQGQTFMASACDCVDKPVTAAPGMTQPQQPPQTQQYPPQPPQQLQPPGPQQNMVYPPQGQPAPMPGNTLPQPQMSGYPQMQMPQMQMPGQMPMMAPQMYPQMQPQPQPQQMPGMTPQQQLYLQALQQQQAALMYGQAQPSMAAWGQAPQQPQTTTPANTGGMGGMPNLMALGAVQGNDMARDMFLAQSLARGITPFQGAGPGLPGQGPPGAGNLDPSLLSWAAMSGNPMANNLMTMNVLQNPQLAPLAAIYGIDQATELAATQSLVSGGMRNPAFGLLSTTFLDLGLPDHAGLMFAAQGASGAGVTPPSAGGAQAGATPADTTNSGGGGGNSRGGGMNLDPLFLSVFLNM